MYIDVQLLLNLCLVSSGIIALVFFSIALYRLGVFLSNLNDALTYNRKSIDYVCDKLPEITDGVKTLTDAASETTVQATNFKNELFGSLAPIQDIITMLFKLFFNKEKK